MAGSGFEPHVCTHWDFRKTHECDCPIGHDHDEQELI